MILSGNEVKEISKMTYFEHTGMLQEQFDAVYNGSTLIPKALQDEWKYMLSAYFSLHSRYEVTDALLTRFRKKFSRYTKGGLTSCSSEEIAVAGLEAEITSLLCKIYGYLD